MRFGPSVGDDDDAGVLAGCRGAARRWHTVFDRLVFCSTERGHDDDLGQATRAVATKTEGELATETD